MAKKALFEHPIMNWDTTDPSPPSRTFTHKPNFGSKDQNVPDANQYIRIIYFLGHKCREIWKSIYWDDNTDCRDPSEVCDKSQASFMSKNQEEAFDLKYDDEEMIQLLEIHLINVLLKCSYPQNKF